MGMDTGAIAGNGKATGRDQAILKGRDDRGMTEDALEPFFIMEREILMAKGVGSKAACNAGMLIGKFFSFPRFPGRLFVFARREKILPASFL